MYVRLSTYSWCRSAGHMLVQIWKMQHSYLSTKVLLWLSAKTYAYFRLSE